MGDIIYGRPHSSGSGLFLNLINDPRNVPNRKLCWTCHFRFQELCETHSTAQCHSNFATQLCCLSKAQKLAMVAPLHKSQAFTSGNVYIYIYILYAIYKAQWSCSYCCCMCRKNPLYDYYFFEKGHFPFLNTYLYST